MAVAATVVVVALTGGGDGPADRRAPAPPAARNHTCPPSAGALPGLRACPSADPVLVMRGLYSQAELYRNPATRSRSDQAVIRTAFANASVYRRVWGGEGLAVTCGQRADGVLSADPTEALFYQGTEAARPQGGDHLLSGLVSAIHCSPSRGTPGDPAVAAHFAHLVGGGEGTVDCGRPRPTSWLADSPGSATQTYGFAATLDGGSPYRIIIDSEQGKVTTDCAP